MALGAALGVGITDGKRQTGAYSVVIPLVPPLHLVRPAEVGPRIKGDQGRAMSNVCQISPKIPVCRGLIRRAVSVSAL